VSIDKIKQTLRESNKTTDEKIEAVRTSFLSPEDKVALVSWLEEKPKENAMAIHSEVKAGEL
jgi:hypothetical protein